MSEVQDAAVADFEQSGRLLQIQTSLGADRALLTEVQGHDRISHPFLFEIEIATRESDDQIRSLLGMPVTLFLAEHTQFDGRPVHGIVKRLSGCRIGARGIRFWRADVVPKLWFLSYVADCRIFQDKSVLDIIETVLQEHNIIDLEIRATRDNYPKMEYCVQYREETLKFISRLMERFGLFYWHEHQPDKHVLVIADDNMKSHPAGMGVATVAAQDGEVTALEFDYSYRPGKWTLTDYDFEAPSKNLLASTPTILNVPQMTQREIYDFPGLYSTRDAGNHFTRQHIEGEEAQHQVLRGTGRYAPFDAGRRCKATSVWRGTGAIEQDLLLIEVRHNAADHAQISGDAPAPYYANEFRAIPLQTPYRHPQVTPRPFVHGPQTAVVTGPSGSEIHTDKYGRVKVRFHWDRNPDGNRDDVSSCWIRVSQAWAGRNWGSIHIPRVGQEVIVDFLEGDPDRPIITGRVYNGDNAVPYDLPGKATQSGIKSHSSPDGSGSNEFRFEDKQGSEEVWFHAQKDLNSKIENDETREVGNDRTTTIDKDDTKTVHGDFKETVKGKETRHVTGDVTEWLFSNETRNVMGNQTENVTGNITVMTPAAVTVTAIGGYNLVAPPTLQTGSTSMSGYGFVLGMAASQVQLLGVGLAVVGAQTQFVGVNVGINGVNIAVGGIHSETTGMKLEEAVTKVKSGAAHIYNAAVHLFD